jgi:cholinesterase
MRSKNTSSILAAIPVSNIPKGSAAFWPTIDETIVYSNYFARSVAGKFIKSSHCCRVQYLCLGYPS